LGTSRDQAFRTVKHAITSDIVRAAAILGGGTDVIVRIIRSGDETVSSDIQSNNLPIGSITIVPEAGVNFELKLNGKRLILERGNKLQGFRITSGDPGDGTGAAAIKIAAAGTPLKDMIIDCRDLGTAGTATTDAGIGDRCIEVTAFSATVTLDNVDVLIKGDKNFTAGIRHVGTSTILRVINGSSVVATGSATGSQGVVGILENSIVGSVEIEGPNTEVNLSAIQPVASGARNVAILLKGTAGPLRKVINSQIRVNEASPGQIGVCVGSSITVTVQGSTFTNSSSGSNSIAICKAAVAASVTPPPLPPVNTFNNFGTSREFVTSSCSCPS